LETVPDDNYATGNASGQGAAMDAIEGDLNVVEYYLEALLPLVQDAPGARDLSLEVGYRFSDYSAAGGASTWKGQVAWAPTASVKLRGGLNRAIRAASIGELYLPVVQYLAGVPDPCANDPITGVPSATLEECMRTGLTPEQYGSLDAVSVWGLGGGNLDLAPETADTLTLGLVVTPEALPGFSATVDYYDIEIADAIGALPADSILYTCLATGDPRLCGLVHRDRYGSLGLTPDGYVVTTWQNIGTIYAEGVDLSLSYLAQMGNAGFLSADLIGTYALANRLANPLIDYDCVGYFGSQCGQTNPDWSHRARQQWDTSFDTSFSLVWRYTGSASNDDFSPNDTLADPDVRELERVNDVAGVDPYSLFDLAATYTFEHGVQVTIGVNNVLDTEPPMWPGLQDNPWVNTYAIYDPLGRYVFTSVRYQF
jgi:outer membrane receptor protein involved in Fe transport